MNPTFWRISGWGTATRISWASTSNRLRPANFENLSVLADNTWAGGNALNNIILGGDGSQQMYGGLGRGYRRLSVGPAWMRRCRLSVPTWEVGCTANAAFIPAINP